MRESHLVHEGGLPSWLKASVRRLEDEGGQDLIEYGFLLVAIVASGVALFPQILTALSDLFSSSNLGINDQWIPNDP